MSARASCSGSQGETLSSAGCCPPRARKCRARERAERCLRIMASQVTCRELHAKNVKLYKVTHGACTLLEYNSAHKDDLDGTDSLQHAEWRALYTQFQADHVLGTVPYRWEKGHAEAVLIEATLASVDIVEIDGPILHDGSVSGGEKAAAGWAVLDWVDVARVAELKLPKISKN